MSSSTRKESERTKFIQEKCQNLLTQMLRDEDNKYCVDCDAKGPRWASWNLGVFLCIRCAGIHRNLGVHISRVKSVNLDSWTPEQVVSLQNMGNSRARAVYEAQLPDGFRRPQTDSALESFIRAKYEHKKYMAREWVPSPPAKADWDKEIDEEMERQKRKKKSTSSLGITSPANATDKKSTVAVKTPIPAPLPKPKTNSSSPKTSRIVIDTSTNIAPSQDLLGLASPPINNGTNIAAGSAKQSSVTDLSAGDAFTSFLSCSPTPAANSSTTNSLATTNDVKNNVSASTVDPTSLAKEEQDFFNQVPTEKEKTKMTKDSIMALYGTAPSASNPTTNILGQFNGNIGGGGIVYNQFSNSIAGFSTNPLPQMHATPNMSGLAFGGHIPPATGQAFGCAVTAQPPAAVTNLFGAQMLGAYQQQSQLITQQQQSQPLQQFASFPPMGVIGSGLPSATATTGPTNTFQMQQPFTHHPSAATAGAAPTNGTLNQQFANLNVWQ